MVLKTGCFIILFAWFNQAMALHTYRSPYNRPSIHIPAGTPVILELDQYVDSESGLESNTVSFRVKYNVIIEGQIVIAAGSKASGHILHADKCKRLGEPGYIEIQADLVTTVNGQEVALCSLPVAAMGENREGIALGLGVGLTCVIGPFGLLFFLLKGGPAELLPGTIMNATVLYDTEV